MKKSVLLTALLVAGQAMAAAPVEDIGGGSADERIAKLERILKAKQQTDFDMQRRLDALQQEVLDLRGQTEQQNYQINQMLERQRKLYEEIANLQAAPAAKPAVAASAGAAVAASQTPAAQAGTVAVEASLNETAAYEKAINLVLKERKYDDAITAFRGFIKQYPGSNYTDNANYWLGQLLYNKNELDDARGAFTVVVEKYPDSSKRGDSLVKLGLIAEKKGDTVGAKNLYRKVVKEYANSAAARIAQQQLNAL
ncbi:tol-pal system protein YbgF [Shewanella khirikhana]|uniref:Cell division coordinator CpoB n=1 Tax=Shewanella khirikhana TaxID=1965282 RepID=A0ABM7DAP8_9GAMM|nr:tol-pal system protein YbgF [Shewanella khirikhana]AZQ10919.1 tol-pal system protein YbgF [Shewanella khirikhana]